MKTLHLTLKATVLVVVMHGATIVQCFGQSGYSNYGGFQSYTNSGGRNYNTGMVGRAPNYAYNNTGFAGVSQTSSGRSYSMTNSSNAARALGQKVNNVMSAMLPAAVQAQQMMGQSASMSGGMLPSSPRQELMRTFFEGGSPQFSGSNYSNTQNTDTSSATSTAYSNYQRAENEATKARNAAQRTRSYDKDQWHRKNSASQAEYAANNANYAAQRAESAAYSGDSQARGYASQARAAANRARADANRARYNADTMS
ncbi:MAG: hypothetical protein JST89_00515 [Cyanobacteria bacterium SZAS-4]|nr:hypothetical protein [Cyanobacteria bacterium SZAS-4]